MADGEGIEKAASSCDGKGW